MYIVYGVSPRGTVAFRKHQASEWNYAHVNPGVDLGELRLYPVEAKLEVQVTYRVTGHAELKVISLEVIREYNALNYAFNRRIYQ